jgi:hypothetical protein
MKHASMFFALALLVGIGVWAASDHDDAPKMTLPSTKPKKLILAQWNSQTPAPALLKKQLEEMEKVAPVDGIVIRVELKAPPPNISPHPMEMAFENRKWDEKWFDPTISDLKSLRFKRFTDNFLYLGANPGTADWFDDREWRAIEDHWRIAAEIVKKAKLKGIAFDPESDRPYHQFEYPSQPQHDRHSFDEYCQKVRQRGREVMKVLAKTDPDLTLFCYFMNSQNVAVVEGPSPLAHLTKASFGLYPAFIDGWLDSLPKTMTLVDGSECSYLYNDDLSFYRQAIAIKREGSRLVSPENHAKYASQVQVGFGFYLDAYLSKAGAKWHVDSMGEPVAERLKRNLETALKASDEYVWIYGERGRWWPSARKDKVFQKWTDRIPGLDKTMADLEAARAPSR